MAISNLGAIKCMTAVPGWTEGAAEAGDVPQQFLKTFRPAAHPDVEISIFFRGVQLDQASATAFREILSGPPRKLPEGGTEVKALRFVLGNAGDNQWTRSARGPDGPAFRLRKVETIEVNGRRVLSAEGQFVDRNDKPVIEFHGIYIDMDGSGAAVQEVFLQVPIKYGVIQFERYRKVFLDSIRSIEWN